MLTGNPTKRTWNGPWPVPDQSSWGPADTTQAALMEKSIGFNCMSYFRSQKNEGTFEHPWIRDKTFTDAMCDNGLRAEIVFPSCWDGKNLDSANHRSHVAYPSVIHDGQCPPTHPVKLPIVFFETIYNTQAFKGVPGQYVMSNGDPTGYGYHADFFASWDDGVQEAVMVDKSCTGPGMVSGHVEDCGAFRGRIQSLAEAATCKMELPQAIRNEKVTGLMDALPGNMPVTGVRHDPGTQPKPDAQSQSPPVESVSSPARPAVDASSSVSSIAAPPTTVAPTVPVNTAAVSRLTSTSIYTSASYVVEMVLIEEIDTVTVTTNGIVTQTIAADETGAGPMTAVATPTVASRTVHRRHGHGRRHLHHGHSHGHL